MKKIIPILVLLIAVHYGLDLSGPGSDPVIVDDGAQSTNTDRALAQAFEQRRENYQVQGEGEVIRILPDDNDGSRHQRFILRLDSGQTLLVAHNIDLAPRVQSLEAGDRVAFNGEYEWTERGGVIHWTHHDPDGYHETGWLKHEGRTYR